LTHGQTDFEGSEQSKGYVYALTSDGSPYVKIGLTTDVPFRRLMSINTDPAYGPLGVWSLLDCRQVKDCRAIETRLHQNFSAARVRDAGTTRELFAISAADAREAFAAIPEADLLGAAPLSKLKLQCDLLRYLHSLLRGSGLENFFAAQGAWTFTLFPGTNRNTRFFTINIGTHEVAFSGQEKSGLIPYHSLVLDLSILNSTAAMEWLRNRPSDVVEARDRYKSALPNGVSIIFDGSLDDATEFLQIDGVRRALLAYWYDYLLDLIDRKKLSFHARFHNYTAVSELFRTMRAERALHLGL
jgi:hypothetical protein